MHVLHRTFTSAAVLAVLLGSPVVAISSYAADMSDTTTPAATTTTTDAATAKLAKHVEERITSLHSKLKITADEETNWAAVADAMRSNEDSIGKIIQERHANAKTMTAVEDMQSYQAIAQAHADGLAKVIPAFETLYSSMPDDQKKLADKVFGSFEGHPDRGSKKTVSK